MFFSLKTADCSCWTQCKERRLPHYTVIGFTVDGNDWLMVLWWLRLCKCGDTVRTNVKARSRDASRLLENHISHLPTIFSCVSTKPGRMKVAVCSIAIDRVPIYILLFSVSYSSQWLNILTGIIKVSSSKQPGTSLWKLWCTNRSWGCIADRMVT